MAVSHTWSKLHDKRSLVVGEDRQPASPQTTQNTTKYIKNGRFMKSAAS